VSTVVIVATLWLAPAFGPGLLLAGGARPVDADEAASVATRNVAVDGNPLAAPLPAPPVVETAKGSTTLVAQDTHRSPDAG
jgi:hypothetical protein